MSRATTSPEYRPASMPRYSAHSQTRVTPFFNTVQHVPEIVAGFDTPLPANSIDSSSRETPQIGVPIEAEEDDEIGRRLTIVIAYAPKNVRSKQDILELIDALKYQYCHKNRKWHGLTITTETYDITTSLDSITDTADSDDPLKPFHLVILLLSPEFVGKPFCYSEQMRPIFVGYRARRQLLCILLHKCKIEGYPFDMLDSSRFLPNRERPISSLGGSAAKYKAYATISQGIEDTIDYLRMR